MKEDFAPDGEGQQLPVSRGDTVTIVQRDDSGWVFCQLGSAEGWVPEYIFQEEPESYPEAVVHSAFTPAEGAVNQMKVQKGDTVHVTELTSLSNRNKSCQIINVQLGP